MTFNVEWMLNLLLLSCRFSILVFFSPLPALRRLPFHLQLFFVLFLSALILAGLNNLQTLPVDKFAVMIAALVELINSFCLNLTVLAAFAGFELAGFLIDSQIGLGSLSILNPQAHFQEPLLGHFFQMLATLLFFSLGGHRILFQSLVASVQHCPLGKLFLALGLKPILTQFASLFAAGLILAAPLLFCMMLVEFACGFLTRNMPQLNIYFLSIPAKMVLGFGLLALLLPALGEVLSKSLLNIFVFWQELIG